MEEKIYAYHICWRYSSENFEFGIVKATSAEEAESKLRKQNPTIIGCNVWEPEFDEDGVYVIYSH